MLSTAAEGAFEDLARAAAAVCTGNARSMRNLLQRIVLQQSSRVAKLPASKRTTAVLQTIEAEDVLAVTADSSL